MITVSLVSTKDGEIRRFFEGTEDARRNIDSAVAEWICVYREVHKAKAVITRLVDGDYDIALWIREDDGDVREVKRSKLPEVLSSLEVQESRYKTN